jgi:D-glycero-alpha-D-manno-heptose 1-phosphate guanylyltransferase
MNHGMFSQTTAVILAGGLGSRLRTVVADRPKVMAEIHGRPFLTYLLDHLSAAGLRHTVLCTGFGADIVHEALGTSYRNLELEYSVEKTALGTGGALRAALPLVRSDPVLVMNGDSFCDVGLVDFWSFRQARQAQAALALVELPDCSRFGRVRLGDADCISSFEEKGAMAGPGWINAGVYLICRDWLGKIADNRPISLERDVFPHWTGPEFLGYRGQGRFIDIGTPESFAQAEGFFGEQ